MYQTICAVCKWMSNVCCISKYFKKCPDFLSLMYMYVHMWWLKNVHFTSSGNYTTAQFVITWRSFKKKKKSQKNPWLSKIAHVRIIAISIAIMFYHTESRLLKVILLWKTHLFSLLKLHFSARSSVEFPVQVLRTGEQNMVCSKNDAIESTDPKLSASLSLCSCTLSYILHSFLHFSFLDVMDRT